MLVRDVLLLASYYSSRGDLPIITSRQEVWWSSDIGQIIRILVSPPAWSDMTRVILHA